MTKERAVISAILLLTANLLTLTQCAGLHPSVRRHSFASESLLNVHGHVGETESLFRTINRRKLADCIDLNPYLNLSVDTAGPLSDVQTVTVNVSGIIDPSDKDWVAIVSPSNSSVDNCPGSLGSYVETGDIAELPLLCHYPVKFQYVKNDPAYLPCNKSTCQVPGLDDCKVKTCTGSLSFRLINIRTDILFVLFTGGVRAPCVLKKAGPLPFNNPNSPLYGHLSSVDSSGSSMRLTWVSGDVTPQTVQYGSGSTTTSTASTFTPANLCSDGAASDFGWHNPGYIHTAIMTGLSPSTQYSYRYGSQNVGFSDNLTFSTPPKAGDDVVTFIAYGDMGKAERDGSLIHYIQPGSLSVIDAVTGAVNSGGVDFVLHIGDISYATGFLVEWENFLEIIGPVASKISYMTAIGNHERDNPNSGSYYQLKDSGGECGIPYYNYFQMPTSSQDKPWYSIESGPVHFTVVSTEHNFTAGTEQYTWIQSDLASVNRSRTPWVIFSGHRPMYSSLTDSLFNEILPSVDQNYVAAVEPLLLNGKVDLSLAGHVHNYERTCAVYKSNCTQTPTKDSAGVDTFDFSTYSSPVQAVIGMSGFTLDGFKSNPADWSTVRISAYGYTKIQATTSKLLFTGSEQHVVRIESQSPKPRKEEPFILANGTVGDTFAIVK